MACGERGNSGVSLCNTQNLCCIQLKENCGTNCDNLPLGYSLLQLTNGELQLCYKDMFGVCNCTAIGSNQPQVVIEEGSSAGSETITIVAIPPNPPQTTTDHLPFQISITNPSPSRQMAIKYEWTGFSIFVEHNRSAGDVDIIIDPDIEIDLGDGGGFNKPTNFVILNNNLGYFDVGGTNVGNQKRTYKSNGYSGVAIIEPTNTFTFRSSLDVTQTITTGLTSPTALVLEQVHASIMGVVI
jgi:hypothetical protein